MNRTTFHFNILCTESPTHLHSHLLLLPYTQATQAKPKESASQRAKTRTVDRTDTTENKQRTANRVGCPTRKSGGENLSHHCTYGSRIQRFVNEQYSRSFHRKYLCFNLR